jgi:ubiquinone/menaquinone biosynthesis C-methylase UbiE
MSRHGHEATLSMYRNAQFVEAYSQANENYPHLESRLRTFLHNLQGKFVLDLGCGHGRDTRQMSFWGCKAIGLDYSEAMLSKAQSLNTPTVHPIYIAADMRNLGEVFVPDLFQASWCIAALIHIPMEDTLTVLRGLNRASLPGSLHYLSLKEGRTETKVVTENKYGMTTEREMTFWRVADFSEVAQQAGFSVASLEQEVSGITQGAPTSWLNFTLRNERQFRQLYQSSKN